MREQKRYIYLSFRPTGSEQTIEVPSAKRIDIRDFIHLSIGWIRVQVTYYAFPESTIILSEDGGAGTNVILAAGNYTITTWMTELASKLSAASPAGATYTLTYSSITGKLTIVVTGAVAAFTLGFATDNRVLERYLGVPPGTAGTPSYQLSSSGTTLVTTNPVIPTGPLMLYIKSRALNNIIVRNNNILNTDIDNAINSDIDDMILGVPQMAEANREFVINPNVECLVASAQQSMPNQIDIDIVDEADNSIDFRGGTVTLQLVLY